MGLRTLDYNAYMREWQRKSKRKKEIQRRQEAAQVRDTRRIARSKIRNQKVAEMRRGRVIDD